MPTNFYRGPRSGRWYVRLVAPAAIRHLVRLADYRQSTGQSDLQKARAVGAALIAEKRREWDSVARRVASGGGNGHYAVPTVLTGPVIQKICAARLCASMSVDEEDRTEGLVEGDLAEIERFCSLTDKSMRSVLALGTGSPRCPEAADSLLMWSATCGHIVDPTRCAVSEVRPRLRSSREGWPPGLAQQYVGRKRIRGADREILMP